jgi:BirA family biotin operon repressor/biotin-[acetyl-CoA-carboxylase] ligase
VTSTNDVAARAAATTANDGLVVLAEEQTAGRGQRGRQWLAPAGSSILMSVLVFPREAGTEPALASRPPAGSAWLTGLAAVATAEVVSEWSGHEAQIKWPNDVRVKRRKIAGILVERVLGRPGGRARAQPRGGVVIGIGLNSDIPPATLPAELRPRAVSLAELAGGPVDRSELARALIRRLDYWYDQVITHGPAALTAPWRARSEHLGRQVIITTPAERLRGLLVDLDLHAGLTLEEGSLASGHAEPPARRCGESKRRQVSLEVVLTLEECTLGELTSPGPPARQLDPNGRSWPDANRDDCLGRASKRVLDSM